MGPGEKGMGEEVVEEVDMAGGIGAMAGGATVVGKAGTCNGSPLVGKVGKSKVSKSRNLRD